MLPRPRTLYFVYWFSFLLLFLLIIGTPYLVKGGISIFEEEVVELIVLSTFTLTSVFLLYRYSQFVRRQSESYEEIIRHIGALNLQVDQVEEIIKSSKALPSTPSEVKKMFAIMGNIILSVVNVDWVFIRVLDTNVIRTLTEKGIVRGGVNVLPLEISNKVLRGGQNPEGCSVFSYKCDTDITLFVIIPTSNITEAQSTIVQTATTNTGMMFKIFYAHNK